jgi:hypothetical protein
MAHGRGHSEDAHNHHRSSERKFDLFTVTIDNQRIGCRRLFCATPGCGQQGELLDRTSGGLVPKVIQRRFEQKGWEVGSSAKHDYCPGCVEHQRTERRQRRFKPVVVSSTPKPSEPKGDTAMSVQAVASETRTMGRDERRIIFAKLEEVYVDEAAGYRTPWTDVAVAKDLNVPLAWVEQMRDENFGPARDNGEIRDMLTRVTAATAQARGILDEAKAVRKDVAGHVEKVNALSHRCTEIGKTLEGLLAIAERIARSVA